MLERRRGFGLVLALALGCPALAEGGEVFGFLELSPTADWKPAARAAGAKSWDWVPVGFEEKAVLRFFPPTSVVGAGLAARVSVLEGRLNQGRRRLRVMPLRVERGASGLPLGLAGSVTADGEGRSRVTLMMGLATGSGVQSAALMALDDKAFEALAPKALAALKAAALSFPASDEFGERLAAGAERLSLVWASFGLFPGLSLVEARGVNGAVMKASLAFEGGAFDVPVLCSAQNRLPEDAAAALEGFLMHGAFGIEAAAGSAIERLAVRDFSIAGRMVTGLIMREKSGAGMRSWRVGFLVYGPGWSLLIGAAVGESRAFGRLSRAQQSLVVGQVFQTLPKRFGAAIASLEWAQEPAVKPRPELKARLMAKGSYRFRYESRLLSGEFSSLVSRKRSWEFRADGSCVFSADSYVGFMDATPRAGEMPSGRITGWGSLEKSRKQPRALFDVVERGAGVYLWVTEPDGWLHVHLLEFDKAGSYGASKSFTGLAIDGQIEGRFYRGSGYQYREEP